VNTSTLVLVRAAYSGHGGRIYLGNETHIINERTGNPLCGKFSVPYKGSLHSWLSTEKECKPSCKDCAAFAQARLLQP
jgi:hypothetical protein